MVIFPVLCSMMLAVAAPAAGQAGTVTGSATVNKQKAALIQPYVDESPDDIIIVLASKEVPRDVVPFIGEDVARKLKIYAVAFTVDRKKKALGTTFSGVFYPGTDMGFVGMAPSNVTLQIKRFDATGIEGRVFTAKPVALGDVTYSFDATFSLPLGKAAPAPPAVTVKISGDMSDPAKAYGEYYKAIFAGDMEKVRAAFAATRRADFDKAKPEERAMLVEFMKTNPAEIRIGKPTVSGKNATLKIEGLNETSGKSTGDVTMVLEDGVWRVLTEKWSIGSK